MMKDAMLQLQMVIPSLKMDASVTATLKKDEVMLMDLETLINLPETSYQQKTSLKYGNHYPSLLVSTQTYSKNPFICIFGGTSGFSLKRC